MKTTRPALFLSSVVAFSFFLAGCGDNLLESTEKDRQPGQALNLVEAQAQVRALDKKMQDILASTQNAKLRLEKLDRARSLSVESRTHFSTIQAVIQVIDGFASYSDYPSDTLESAKFSIAEYQQLLSEIYHLADESLDSITGLQEAFEETAEEQTHLNSLISDFEKIKSICDSSMSRS